MKKTFLLSFMALLASFTVFAQTAPKPVDKGWHLLDYQKNGVYGVSMDKAYDYVKGKKSTTILVAVIDAGIDTLHEDLKDVLWINPNPAKTGYINDVHGWNFLGGKDGSYVEEDSFEGARVYFAYKNKYDGKVIDTNKLAANEKFLYNMWLKAKNQLTADAAGSGGEKVDLSMMKKVQEACETSDKVLKKAMGKDTYTGKDLDTLTTASTEVKRAKAALQYFMQTNNMLDMTNKEFIDGLTEYIKSEERKRDGLTQAPKPYRADVVKDNENDINDRYYGNNDVMCGNPYHGTHVSGIIAAKRNNGVGMDGVADNVKIMAIRAVPDGDEHDKDIALAIRFAADNGARVVNMSFGKSYSPQKQWVDDAVKYAESKGVLLVHAAGNDAKDIDVEDNFPRANYLGSGRATNWITVGASSDPTAEPAFPSYTASFSNYGKTEVDVFAPGTKIYSTIPGGNTYGMAQGTSMASPVVAGVAAFVLSYYPGLTAQQLKSVIEKSAVKPAAKVLKPGTDEEVSLSELCTSGGIVNAYEAIKLAATLYPDAAAGKTTGNNAPAAKPAKKKKK